MKMRRFALVALLGASACSSGSNAGVPDAGVGSVRTAATSAPTTVAPTAASSVAADANDCDAHARWFGDASGASPEEHKKAFVALLKGWTPECRRKGFDAECAHRCDAFISDMIIDAAAGNAEKRSLLADRVERNAAAQKMADQTYKEVAAFLAHAQATAGEPREMSPACMTRMRADFDAIDTLSKKIEASALLLPEGTNGVIAALNLAKGCVDCTSNRLGCTDMMTAFNGDQDNLTDWQKELDADRSRLASMPLK